MYEDLFERLSRSKFRSRFHLKDKDKQYVTDKGIETIREHAEDLIDKKIAAAFIANDGKQTPTKGHPVFIAQHATACCCRGCLEKWHHIKPGKKLTDQEKQYVVDVIMKWIDKEMEGYVGQEKKEEFVGQKKKDEHARQKKKDERFEQEKKEEYEQLKFDFDNLH
ncbi:MAG: DUF4186 domain-containing protein [Lachnospiraceae bacterium]|nr:DUF4186 domain-containing protein [Lachnospiraceae bacterium]MBQ9232550.1 DUF4186 domain-containing protein [Lachnospiraceae bacterium]